MKILMVCLGNICRSPMAEGILRARARDSNKNIAIDSAGTGNYHVGEHPDHRAIECLRNHDIDISKLRARQFSTADFEEFDLILAMDQSNFNNISKLARTPEEQSKIRLILDEYGTGVERDVPDPYFGDSTDFEEVYELLSSACDKLIASI